MRNLGLALAASVLLAPSLAAADTAHTDRADTPFEIGARVGGYGFHREGATDPTQTWSECRMNGLGVFGTRALAGPLFVEAGVDLYASTNSGEPGDLPIDRTSGLVSTAIGARTQVTSWLRGYLQVGAGVELARLSVPYGDERVRDSKAMPEGFFGFGVDLRIARGTYVGSAFRTLVMGNFDYDPARLDMSQGWVAAPSSGEVFDASPDVANQLQFYVRREL